MLNNPFSSFYFNCFSFGLELKGVLITLFRHLITACVGAMKRRRFDLLIVYLTHLHKRQVSNTGNKPFFKYGLVLVCEVHVCLPEKIITKRTVWMLLIIRLGCWCVELDLLLTVKLPVGLCVISLMLVCAVFHWDELYYSLRVTEDKLIFSELTLIYKIQSSDNCRCAYRWSWWSKFALILFEHVLWHKWC